RIGQEHGVGIDTVRAALVILRGEGLVQTRARYGSRVRRPQRRQVRVPRGSSVEVWMPTPEQRREHGLPEGVPAVAITYPGGRVEVLPADEVRLTCS
ncbi:MAG TPA: GntR family transcriptional regulator, partial [Micromonosporaceae bacterium]